ncbi:MAG TPA: hypothetical protein V6D34_13305 [Candidatus Sericytochromatia bacterium]
MTYRLTDRPPFSDTSLHSSAGTAIDPNPFLNTFQTIALSFCYKEHSYKRENVVHC